MVMKWLFVGVHKKMFLATTLYLFDISDETRQDVGMSNIENNALITFFIQKAVGRFFKNMFSAIIQQPKQRLLKRMS